MIHDKNDQKKRESLLWSWYSILPLLTVLYYDLSLILKISELFFTLKWFLLQTILVAQGYGNRCEKKDEIELYEKQNTTTYICWPFPECLDGQEPTVDPGSRHPMGTDISCRSCQQNFFSNKGTNIRCRKCTSCGKKLEHSPCLSVKDRVCADRCISNDYYFNSTDQECHRCTECCEGDNINIELQCIKITPGIVIGGKGQKHCRRSSKPCNNLPKKNVTSSGCDCNCTVLSDSSLLKGSDRQMNSSLSNNMSLIEKSFDSLHITLFCLLGLCIIVIVFLGWLAWKRRKQSSHSEDFIPLETLRCSNVRNVTCLHTCSSLAGKFIIKW